MRTSKFRRYLNPLTISGDELLDSPVDWTECRVSFAPKKPICRRFFSKRIKSTATTGTTGISAKFPCRFLAVDRGMMLLSEITIKSVSLKQSLSTLVLRKLLRRRDLPPDNFQPGATFLPTRCDTSSNRVRRWFPTGCDSFSNQIRYSLPTRSDVFPTESDKGLKSGRGPPWSCASRRRSSTAGRIP